MARYERQIQGQRLAYADKIYLYPTSYIGVSVVALAQLVSRHLG